MLYENLRRISVSDGVLISTATLENCFIPISRLLHFGIEKIGTARHLKRAQNSNTGVIYAASLLCSVGPIACIFHCCVVILL